MSEQRIPSLDGCRAIAILLVLVWHLSFSKPEFLKVAFDGGTLGVFIFFVISGFLITTLLLREREKTQSISLQGFYTRRFFRIFPPLFVFLVGTGILGKLGLADANGRSLLFSLSFLRNYHPGTHRILQHLWSLSVEEQFYLLWPFMFTYLPRKTVNRLLIGVVVAVPLIRLAAQYWLGGQGVWHTERVADGLAWGCLVAINQNELRANRLYQWFSHSYGALILPCLIVAAAYTYPPMLYEGLGKSTIFVCVALAIDIVILRSNSLAGKTLNFAPLAWIGKLSYSLYLWQQVFLIVKRENQPYAWFPLNLGLAFTAALISYYLVEKPAIQFGREVVGRRRAAVPALCASALSQS